jgi:hypothetical protein
MAAIPLRKRPPVDAPGRTRTCDPLLRRREQLLRSTATCRSGRSTSDGPHIAAAFCCGLPLPPRFHVDPPGFTKSDSEVSELAALLRFVPSDRLVGVDRYACLPIAAGAPVTSGNRPSRTFRARPERPPRRDPHSVNTRNPCPLRTRIPPCGRRRRMGCCPRSHTRPRAVRALGRHAPAAQRRPPIGLGAGRSAISAPVGSTRQREA